MRLPLFWRMVAPSLIVSVVLLTVGLAAAIYVYLWNSRVATELDRRLAITLQANEVVLSLRDVRLALDQHLATQEPAALELARARAQVASEQLREISRLNGNQDEQRVQQTLRFAKDLIQRLGSAGSPAGSDLQQVGFFVRERFLKEAYALVARCRQEVVDLNQQNQHVAGMVGTGLAMLGLCGAVAGLLAGYSVARSVSLSIEQLGGSVQALAETLDDDSARDELKVAGLRELIAAMGKISSQTAGVVNELEQSRDSAARSDQLAAVGQLAAGIAHELRNPLAAVKLLVDAAVEEDRPLADEDLLVTQGELARINRMFASFLDFARPPALRREQIDLRDLLSEVINLVRPRAKVQDVLLEYRPQERLPLDGDPQQIRQVFLNLVLNALDALPGGGKISIDAQRTSQEGIPAYLVRVTDDGPGISPQIAETLFDPFVSTKDTGVGLGLAISRRIVESHGGAIGVESPPGGGAQFTISLPSESTTLNQSANHLP